MTLPPHERLSRDLSRTGPRRPWLMLCALLALCCALLPASADAKKRKDDSKKSSRVSTKAEERPDIGYYATTISHAENESLITQYWSKGALMRSEIIVAGHPIITLVNGDFYYTYDALTKVGYSVGRSAYTIRQDEKRKRPFANDLEEMRAGGGEKVRTEKLHGVPVDVYRLTDDEGRKTLWITTDGLELPIHLEKYSRATKRTGQLDWINWLPGLVISDAFFVPPADVEFTHFADYETYIDRLRQGPIPPAPPLFHRLLHTRE
jgi:outer membrane lipoprotein-sorting protein